MDGERNLSLQQRAIVLACVASAYASSWWPAHWVLAHGLDWLGNPPCAGFRGKFLPHALLYSTVSAVVSAILWLILSRARLLPPMPLGCGHRLLFHGVLGAIIAMAATIALILSMPSLGSLHWIGFDPWDSPAMSSPISVRNSSSADSSLAGLAAVIGFWPAAVLVGRRAYIGAIGIVWCWIRLRARTLWAPYLSHEILDTVLNAVIG